MTCRSIRYVITALLAVTASACSGPKRPALAITEFPPEIVQRMRDFPVNGGRTQAIAVDPRDSKTIVIATQFGGLWKTTGTKWMHLSSLPALFAQDVAFSPEGTTLYATLLRDNRTDNGGGIWISRDGGSTWSRPVSAVPPSAPLVPARISAWGIAVDRYRRDRVYVATDYGVAISEDAGSTWRHKLLTPPYGTAAKCVLDLPSNVVLATSARGVYRSTDGGETWTIIQAGNFWAGDSGGFKTMDNAEHSAYPFGRPPRPPRRGYNNTYNSAAGKLVLILQDVSTLFLYDDADQSFSTIPLPAGDQRGPFVRVSVADDPTSIFVWVGAGVNLLRTKVAPTKAALSAIAATDWKAMEKVEGIHADTGHLGVDVNKRPVLFGSDGGIFRPANADWSQWRDAATGKSGWNSLQITDLAGTNTEPRPNVFVNSLYFSTQDNGIWASSDGGLTWPTYDCAEGFHIELRKDAPSDADVQVAYGKVGCGPSNLMFSDAHLLNQRAAPAVDSSGTTISGMQNIFLVSPGKYARARVTPTGAWEIWVSSDNGVTWRKRYNLAAGISVAGVFQFTESSERGYLPVTFSPIPGAVPARIGLMPIIRPFRPGVVTLGMESIRSLPNHGSLGVRATEFDWQAVFGLHRSDYRWLIAPDIKNNLMLVSRDAGLTWTPDLKLTTEVTKSGTLLMYDGDAFHTQVTHISFDPYNTNRILVGTRESGVMMSDDGGGRWWTVFQSWPLLYGTGFAFRRDDMAIASAYGRGLWLLNLRYRLRLESPLQRDCTSCTVVEVGAGKKLDQSPKDLDSFVATGGSITGARVRRGRLEAVTLSPGARWTRYLDVTKPATEIAIETADLSRGLRRLMGDMPEGQRVNGFLLRDTDVVAAILAPEPFPNPVNLEPPPDDPRDDDRDAPNEPVRPYITAITDTMVSNRAIVGHEGDVRIVGGGFAPNTHVEFLLDGQSMEGGWVSSGANGAIEWHLRDIGNLSYGEHVVEVNQGDIRVQTQFVKAHIDRLEREHNDH
jgi:hypothetical protein